MSVESGEDTKHLTHRSKETQAYYDSLNRRGKLLFIITELVDGPFVCHFARSLSEDFFNGKYSLKGAYDRIERIEQKGIFAPGELRDKFDQVSQEEARNIVNVPDWPTAI